MSLDIECARPSKQTVPCREGGMREAGHWCEDRACVGATEPDAGSPSSSTSSSCIAEEACSPAREQTHTYKVTRRKRQRVTTECSSEPFALTCG